MSYRKHLMPSDMPPSELYKATEVGTEAINCVMVMKGIRSGKSATAEAVDCAKRIIADNIRQLPPIQPKRGRWIKLDMHRGMADHKCTACKQECYVPTCMGEPMYAYCPNCGAKMEVNHESN